MALIIPESHTVKCGDKHGAPLLHSPKLKSQRQFYWGNIGETEIYGGQGGRNIIVNCILNDVSWVNASWVYSYIKAGLDPLIGANGELQCDFPDGSSSTFDAVTFEDVIWKPQQGHSNAAPLIDVTGTINGTENTWWLEVDLVFYQLQAQLNNSEFDHP